MNQAMTQAARFAASSTPSAARACRRARELASLCARTLRPARPIAGSRKRPFKPMRKAGLMRVCTPKRYGGWEMNTRAMLDVSSAIAEADGGAAWVANLNNVCCWLTSLFPVKAQDEVFGADPDACVSGVLNPTADATKWTAAFASPARGTTIPAAGTPNGRCSACRSSMQPAKRSTRAWRCFRCPTWSVSIPGSSPA